MAAKKPADFTPPEQNITGDSIPVEKACSMITIPLVVVDSVTVLAFGWVLKYGAPLAALEVLLFSLA